MVPSAAVLSDFNSAAMNAATGVDKAAYLLLQLLLLILLLLLLLLLMLLLLLLILLVGYDYPYRVDR